MNTVQSTLLGHRLTTAEILYHMPDFPDLLQSFIWQHLDMAPNYPRLRTFLDYWRDNLEGELHSVRIGTGKLNSRSEFRHANIELRLH